MDSTPVSSSTQTAATTARQSADAASAAAAGGQQSKFSDLLSLISGGNTTGNQLPASGKSLPQAEPATTLPAFAPVNKLSIAGEAEGEAPFIAPLQSTLQSLQQGTVEALDEATALQSVPPAEQNALATFTPVESLQLEEPSMLDETTDTAMTAATVLDDALPVADQSDADQVKILEFSPVSKLSWEQAAPLDTAVEAETSEPQPLQADLAALQMTPMAQQIRATATSQVAAANQAVTEQVSKAAVTADTAEPETDAIINANYVTRPLQPQAKPAGDKSAVIAKAETVPQAMTLSERYSISDNATRQKIFEQEWANAQALTNSAVSTRSGAETAPLNPSTGAVPEDGLPPFVSTLNATTGPLAAGSTGTLQSATPLSTPQTVQLAQRGWENTMANNITYMVRENMRTLQVQVNPAELGPISIELSMQDDKLSLNMQASQSLTRDMLEQAAPRIRELLAGNEQQASVDVNVRDHSQQSQQQFADSASSGNGAAGTTTGTANDVAMADGNDPTEVIQTSQAGLVDLFA